MRYITSFGPEGYKQYGRDFLVSYVKHMPTPIMVYVEEPCDFKHPLVSYKSLNKCLGIKTFMSMLHRTNEETGELEVIPAFRGIPMGGGPRNYRRDIHKFCRKSFAQIDASLAQSTDWLIWIDADVELSGKLPAPTGNAFMHYLGRPEWHSCASYVAWNLRHPMSGLFWKNYGELYISGTVFALSEWHDSYILDQLRIQLDVPSVNLAEQYADQLKGPANVFDIVFPMGHHKKGNLKLAKAS